MADRSQPGREDRGQGTIWTRPRRGSRGPEPEHTHDEIAAVAAALADAGGLAAVTMRAVAQGLGTSAGSLYRYVASRKDLVDLMADAAVGEVGLDTEPTGEPVADLLALAGRQLALYRRHPWLPDAMQLGPAPGPRTVDYLEYCLRLMAPLACDTMTKLESVGVMTGVTSLFARGEALPAPYPLPVTPGAHPYLSEALTRSRPGAARGDLFERAVRSVLRGLLTG